MSSHKIGIIGAGASGTICAIELLQKTQNFAIDIINDSSTICRGLAYSTNVNEHLLNVPCKKMSVLKNDPLHFFNWLNKNGSSSDPDTFAARNLYGKYLEHSLSEIQNKSVSKITFRHGETVAIRKIKSGIELELENNQKLTYDFVIIASGWGSRHQTTKDSKRIIKRPYSIPDTLPAGDEALIFGSSLTAIDALITLRKQGFQGKICMISRRGLLPKTHLLNDPAEPYMQLRRTLRAQLRFFREQFKIRAAKSLSWHGLIDGFRAYTQDFWHNLSEKEKSAFLRHLRPYWDIHRHRIAPQIAEIIKNEINSNKLEIICANIISLTENQDHISAEIRKRGRKTPETLKAAFCIDARGVKSLNTNSTPQFISLMLKDGTAVKDFAELGINCTLDCQLLDSQDRVMENIFLLGPVTAGSLWESIAIPDIVPMAGKIASQIEELVLDPVNMK